MRRCESKEQSKTKAGKKKSPLQLALLGGLTILFLHKAILSHMITNTKSLYKLVDVERYPDLNRGTRALLRSLTILSKFGSQLCCYSDKEAAQDLGVSERSAQRYFALLEQKGYIETRTDGLVDGQARRIIKVNPDKLVLANQQSNNDLTTSQSEADASAMALVESSRSDASAKANAKAAMHLELTLLSKSMSSLASTEAFDLGILDHAVSLSVPGLASLDKLMSAVNGHMLNPRNFYTEETLLMLYNIGINFPLLQIAEGPIDTKVQDLMVDYVLDQGVPFPAIKPFLTQDEIPQEFHLALNQQVTKLDNPTGQPDRTTRQQPDSNPTICPDKTRQSGDKTRQEHDKG